MTRVLVVEDDVALREECARLLGLNGYAVTTCDEFEDVVGEILRAAPDCVILDLHLPGADGLSACRDVRRHSNVPIVVLTSSDSEFDEVMAMNLGADDYVTKPYSPAVLLARVQSAIRRCNATAHQAIDWHGISVDAARSTASFEGETTDLTRNELRILLALVRARGAVVSRTDLMCELWESDEFVDDNTLTVNVNRLRGALATLGVPAGTLVTHRGWGYSL